MPRYREKKLLEGSEHLAVDGNAICVTLLVGRYIIQEDNNHDLVPMRLEVMFVISNDDEL